MASKQSCCFVLFFQVWTQKHAPKTMKNQISTNGKVENMVFLWGLLVFTYAVQPFPLPTLPHTEPLLLIYNLFYLS